MKAWIDLQDKRIRIGQGQLARAELLTYLGQQAVARQSCVAVASLCRRTGLADRSVKLLWPYVRPDGSSKNKYKYSYKDKYEYEDKDKSPSIMRRTPSHLQLHTTSLEKAEYAAALVQIGAELEGLEILAQIDPVQVPRVYLYSALAHFSRWDYLKSVPLLEAYVAHPELSNYERRVGQVNLAAANVALDVEYPSLDVLIKQTKDEGLMLLHANLLEIKSQFLLAHNRLKEARLCLEQAALFMEEMGQTDVLFIKKWTCVLRAKEIITYINRSMNTDINREIEFDIDTDIDRDQMGCADLSDVQRFRLALGAARTDLLRLRDVALSMGHSETVRDIDFHLIQIFRDSDFGSQKVDANNRVCHLYFGSPFESYRSRIESQLHYKSKTHYDWQLSEQSTFILDPLHAPDLKTGMLLQRLLFALCKDFYRSQRVVSIHAELFPGRHFNPLSSPAVVHQAIKRLRIWARKTRVPLEIYESGGAYRLGGNITIRLTALGVRLEASEARFTHWLEKIERESKSMNSLAGTAVHTDAPIESDVTIGGGANGFGYNFFTHADAVAWGGLSARSTSRQLSFAVESGKLIKTGAGKNTRYQLN
jgi:hypothetical protein